MQDMTPEWIEFSRCILFFGNTGAKKDEQLHMASCVLFIFCRLFYYFQNIIGRAVQTSAHFGKNGKVNAGNLVLAVIIELSPLQAAFLTHKVFTFMFFF